MCSTSFKLSSFSLHHISSTYNQLSLFSIRLYLKYFDYQIKGIFFLIKHIQHHFENIPFILIVSGDIRILIVSFIRNEYGLECCIVINLSLLLNIQWMKIT